MQQAIYLDSISFNLSFYATTTKNAILSVTTACDLHSQVLWLVLCIRCLMLFVMSLSAYGMFLYFNIDMIALIVLLVIKASEQCWMKYTSSRSQDKEEAIFNIEEHLHTLH